MKYKTSNGIEIDVVIERKKNKNVYFRVKDDLKLYISCPIYASQTSILNLIKENEPSIIKLYDKAVKRGNKDNIFEYLGKDYYIKIDNSVSTVSFKDNFVYAASLDDLNRFYNTEVIKIFTEEVELIKKCFNNLPEFSLKFRKMKTRWGVCNRSKMTVTLNTELLKKDITLLDYVIVHELCHFYEGNHGKEFWHLVSLAYPKYKEARKRLRE